MQLSLPDARERGGGHCAGSQWEHDGFWLAGWRFVEGDSHTMPFCITRLDSIAWMSPHTQRFNNISQQPGSFTRHSSSPHTAHHRPKTSSAPRPVRHHPSTPCRPDWPHDATWTRITSPPPVAPTGPTTPHGPESRHHHSSTPGRPD